MNRASDDLAYWLEVAEVRAITDLWRALAGLPGNPFAVAITSNDETATVSMGALDIGLFNRSVGLGIGDPASEAQIDAALDFFRLAGRTSWILQVSPLARPSSLEHWLETRGLRRGRRWAKFWRDTNDPPATQTDLRIDEVGREHAADFDRVVVAAFEMPDAIADATSRLVDRDGWHTYLAFDGAEAVGAAALFVTGDVGWLGFGATLESHRGRGSQGAMFARRIVDAAALGVRLVVTETGEDLPEDPNPSYRNMLRAGFRLGYLRQNWLPPEAPTRAGP